MCLRSAGVDETRFQGTNFGFIRYFQSVSKRRLAFVTQRALLGLVCMRDSLCLFQSQPRSIKSALYSFRTPQCCFLAHH
jgi:hypothetical protein